MNSDESLLLRLRDELTAVPRVAFELDSAAAFRLLGLLQLALRHPLAHAPFNLELVERIAGKLAAIGPAAAEVIELGRRFERE